ncbi:putative reverse transcriptase domain-containing protein [Tanacetum coccineum]
MPVTRQGANDAMTPESIQAMTRSGIPKKLYLLRELKGVVGCLHWLEKMESIFHISGCDIDNQGLRYSHRQKFDGHIYCPKGEIKKLEIELWNLRVRGNDVAAYTQRFQELALMCTKFLADETEKIDKYISGLPDNIIGMYVCKDPKLLMRLTSWPRT